LELPISLLISESEAFLKGRELVEEWDRKEFKFRALRILLNTDRIEDGAMSLCKIGRHAAITARLLSIILQYRRIVRVTVKQRELKQGIWFQVLTVNVCMCSIATI